MEITETCIGDSVGFSIDNADEQVCKDAYRVFLHNHQTHEGHEARMTTAKAIFQSMTIPPIVKT